MSANHGSSLRMPEDDEVFAVVTEKKKNDGKVFPVDTKKGRAPDEGLWPADRVQLSLQGLLLRAHGYTVAKIAAWYHGSRKRVEIELTDALVAEAESAVAKAEAWRDEDTPPAPLVDSPKCRGCSLNSICLPDEVNAVGRDHLDQAAAMKDGVRKN